MAAVLFIILRTRLASKEQSTSGTSRAKYGCPAPKQLALIGFGAVQKALVTLMLERE